MPNFGMNPEQLHGAGGSMSSVRTDAQSAGTGFVGSIGDASGAVHHPVMRTALEGYAETWTRPANALAHNVDAAGSQVQGAAVDGFQGDQEAGSGLAPAVSSATSQAPAVRRPINAM
ncbi:MAG: hypothetical protein L0K86_01470 [Actinomycetia bacterium]|nr:hypothetical protein [Actinomycetes bacterium]